MNIMQPKIQWLMLIIALGIVTLSFIHPIFAVVGSVLCCFFSYKFPRKALILLLIYLPFSGTITYQWLGGNALAQFFQDFLYFPAAISLIFTARKQQNVLDVPTPLKWSLWIILGVSGLTLIFVNLLEQLSASSEEGLPFMMGLLGLKTFIGYIPLIWGGYYLIRTEKDIHWVTRLWVSLIIVCCLLLGVQYILLNTGVCVGTRGMTGDDLFKASIDAKCFVGGSLGFTPSYNFVRLPGTFPSPWHWSWFLISSAFIVSASAWSDQVKRWKIVSFIAMGLLVVAVILSGQQNALILVPTILIFLGIMTHLRWQQSKLGLVAGSLVCVFLMVILPNFLALLPHLLRFHFITEQFSWVMGQNVGLLGYGLGTATNSARIFGPIQLVETFYPKVLYETGYLGLLAFLGVVTSVCWVVYQKMRSHNPSKYQGYALCIWLFLLLVSYNNYWYPLDTIPVNIYYWLWAGIALKLPFLEANEG